MSKINSPSSSTFVCPIGNDPLYAQDLNMNLSSVLKTLNDARMHPQDFATTIKQLFIDPVDPNTGVHCRWGIELREIWKGALELYNFLKNEAQPVLELSGNGCLTVSSHNHAVYMAMNKLLTHDEVIGGTTDNLNSRLKRLAKFSSAGESIGTIQKKHLNSRSLIGHILLDDGIISRVNRKDLYDNNWKIVGIGFKHDGPVVYYSFIYASLYKCIKQDMISDRIKRQSGADMFFQGLQTNKDQSSIRYLQSLSSHL